MTRVPRLLTALALALALGAAAVGLAQDGREAELRRRAAELFERRERARLDGGVALEPLGRELVALADALAAAGLDSLAASARHRAAGVLVGLGRSAEAEAQIRAAIASAARAGVSSLEISARAYLADFVATRDPAGALRMVRALVPRMQAMGREAGLGDLRLTESRAWLALGRAQDAHSAALRAASHYRRANVPYQEARSLTQASQSLRFLGRHGEALVLADSVVAIGARRSIGIALARAHLERASVLRTLGRAREGLAAVDEAMALDRRLGAAAHLTTSRRFRAALLLDAGEPLECLIETDTLLVAAETARDHTIGLHAARIRAAALLGLGRAAEAEAALAGRLAAFEDAAPATLGDEDRAAFAGHEGPARTTLARALLERGREADAWRASERGRARALKQRLGAPPVPEVADLLGRLERSRAALVQFNDLDPDLGAVFVLAGGRVTARPIRIALERTDLRLALDRLSAPVAGRRDEPALMRLGAALLEGVWAELPQDVSRLVIVPPTDLHDLPFEALPVPAHAGGGTLGERWAVSYLPAAGLLAPLATRPAAGAGMTVVAAPAIAAAAPAIAALDDDVRRQIVRPLPHALEEARALAGPGVRVLAGRDATLERIAAAPPPAVLHFATHAVEDPTLAPRGALALAGTPSLLTAARVESLAAAADLVSLSACRTLGSVAYRDEGAFGLARAFLVAGARTVVTTRWDVGDRAAARMMDEFYDGLRAGLARDESLARARAALERDGFPSRDRWAFMLLGLGDAPLPLAARAAPPGAAGRSRGPAK